MGKRGTTCLRSPLRAGIGPSQPRQERPACLRPFLDGRHLRQCVSKLFLVDFVWKILILWCNLRDGNCTLLWLVKKLCDRAIPFHSTRHLQKAAGNGFILRTWRSFCFFFPIGNWTNAQKQRPIIMMAWGGNNQRMLWNKKLMNVIEVNNQWSSRATNHTKIKSCFDFQSFDI